jgi:hypothetical protein
MRQAVPLVLLVMGCANLPVNTAAQNAAIAKGPWSEVPAVEMPTGDTSIPIGLLRDVADALLKRPGARVCGPMSQRPIVGASTEYCLTVYVAGDRDSLSWRVTEPVRGNHGSCEPFFEVKDEDFPASQVWIVGYIHNHPCGAPPSSFDLGAWPTNAFDPYVAMAEVRLIPGNPAPAMHRTTAIEGEVQQWSHAKDMWVTLGTCAPRRSDRRRIPECSTEPLRLLDE